MAEVCPCNIEQYAAMSFTVRHSMNYFARIVGRTPAKVGSKGQSLAHLHIKAYCKDPSSFYDLHMFFRPYASVNHPGVVQLCILDFQEYSTSALLRYISYRGH
jgi:hypothetical protein